VKHEIVTYPLRTVKRDRIISVTNRLHRQGAGATLCPLWQNQHTTRCLRFVRYPSGLVPQTRAFESGPGAVGSRCTIERPPAGVPYWLIPEEALVGLRWAAQDRSHAESEG